VTRNDDHDDDDDNNNNNKQKTKTKTKRKKKKLRVLCWLIIFDFMCDSDASMKFIQTFCNILFKQTDIFFKHSFGFRTFER
jgi:hypothetical protein